MPYTGASPGGVVTEEQSCRLGLAMLVCESARSFSYSLTVLAACTSSSKTTDSRHVPRARHLTRACDSSRGDVDAGLRSTRHSRPIQQSRRDQGRAQQREERLGTGAGDLGRKRVLRSAREMDRVEGRQAGRSGRSSGGEPARRSLGAELVQRWQDDDEAALQLLPRFPQGLERQDALPAHPRLEGRVSRSSGD